MRLLSTFIIVLFLIACNNSAKKKEDIKDTANQIIQMSETLASPDTIFTGFGTEPFWSVYVIKDSKIVFHPADGPDVEMSYAIPLAPDSITTKYNTGNGSTTMELTIVKKNCSDGMSEETHQYQITLIMNKTKYSGCGRED